MASKCARPTQTRRRCVYTKININLYLRPKARTKKLLTGASLWDFPYFDFRTSPGSHQRVTASPESQGVTMEPSGRAGDARDWGFLEPLGARADIAVPGIGGARTYPALFKSFLWPSKIGLGNGSAWRPQTTPPKNVTYCCFMHYQYTVSSSH